MFGRACVLLIDNDLHDKLPFATDTLKPPGIALGMLTPCTPGRGLFIRCKPSLSMATTIATTSDSAISWNDQE